MEGTRLRRVVDRLRRTPFHPQWLLGAPVNTAKALSNLHAGRVLDIGCADRWVERHLPADCEYVGLDYPDTGLAWYGARPHVLADAAVLPFADASVDTVVILDVLEHVARPGLALAEIARVLRPQGQLLLSMPFLYPVHDAPQDFQRYTVYGLRREVEAVGLRVDRIEPSLASAESAGLMVNLALGGMAVQTIQRRSPAMVLLPFLAPLVPIVNLLGWLLGRCLPSWDALTAGYFLTARKP